MIKKIKRALCKHKFKALIHVPINFQPFLYFQHKECEKCGKVERGVYWQRGI